MANPEVENYVPAPEMFVVLHYHQPQAQVAVCEGTITVSVPHIFGPFGARETANSWARSQYFIAYEVIQLEAP